MADDFGFGFDPAWSMPDFNFQFPSFDMPMDFGFGFDPSFAMPDFNFAFPSFDMPAFDFGFGMDPSWMQMDPLALPTFSGMEAFQPAFMQGGGGGFAPAPGMSGAPMSLADLGFGGSGAMMPTTFPDQTLGQSSDPMVTLMGQPPQGGLGYDPGMGMDMESMFGPASSGLPGGAAYGQPGGGPLTGLTPVPGLGGAPYAPGAEGMAQLPGLGAGFNAQGQPISAQERYYQTALERMNKPASGWDTAAKLAAAFGPAALGAAGLGMQAANQPERNPLEDELIRARIASSGLQDTLAKDRLAFEKSNAEAMRAFQERMQAAMLESRQPGGQANINALLQGNPQLAALYQALTQQGTKLASGDTPEFNAQVEQLAQVDITELQRQAQQQIAQAMEMANRQGVNPANIIAQIQQRVLQESAKARTMARQTLIQMMGAGMQPGTQAFGTIGNLFGNLFQVPGA